jgi:hypothetical protein
MQNSSQILSQGFDQLDNDLLFSPFLLPFLQNGTSYNEIKRYGGIIGFFEKIDSI